jgi:hypothetical protein
MWDGLPVYSTLKEQTMNATTETLQLDLDVSNVIQLSQFVADFGDGLLQAVTRKNPPVFDGTPDPRRDAVMRCLKRQPFPAQRAVVQAIGQRGRTGRSHQRRDGHGQNHLSCHSRSLALGVLA